jgi:hypothetical protein
MWPGILVSPPPTVWGVQVRAMLDVPKGEGLSTNPNGEFANMSGPDRIGISFQRGG